MDYEQRHHRSEGGGLSQYHMYFNSSLGYATYTPPSVEHFNTYPFSQSEQQALILSQPAPHSPSNQTRSVSNPGWNEPLVAQDTEYVAPLAVSPPATTSTSKLKRDASGATLIPNMSLNQPTAHTPAPRKTLTDRDRRAMCEYAEAHPGKKQTEIGEMFGVERSTVSKVLRQKEKFMKSDEELKSPQRRTKGKHTDLERAMVIWARKEERNGSRVPDHEIREQAHKFMAANRGPPDPNFNIDDPIALKNFKKRHNVGRLSTSEQGGTDGNRTQLQQSPNPPGAPETTNDTSQLNNSTPVHKLDGPGTYISPVSMSDEPMNRFPSIMQSPPHGGQMLRQVHAMGASTQPPHSAPMMQFFDQNYLSMDATHDSDHFQTRGRSQTYPYSVFTDATYSPLGVQQPSNNLSYPPANMTPNTQWNAMGPPAHTHPQMLNSYYPSPHMTNIKSTGLSKQQSPSQHHQSTSTFSTPALSSSQTSPTTTVTTTAGMSDDTSIHNTTSNNNNNTTNISNTNNRPMTNQSRSASIGASTSGNANNNTNPADIPSLDQAQSMLESLKRYCQNRPHDLKAHEVTTILSMDKVRLRPSSSSLSSGSGKGSTMMVRQLSKQQQQQQQQRLRDSPSFHNGERSRKIPKLES